MGGYAVVNMQNSDGQPSAYSLIDKTGKTVEQNDCNVTQSKDELRQFLLVMSLLRQR